MYNYFTAKIYDSMRQVETFNRSEDWNLTNIQSDGVVNKPNLKGCVIDTSKVDNTTPGYGFSRVRKNTSETTHDYKINDLIIVRCKHDKPILIGLNTDSYPLTSDLVSETLNVKMGSHYESYVTRKVTANGKGRFLIDIIISKSENNGILKVWDCERLYELGAYPAKPIYVTTAIQPVKIDDVIAMPYLSIPENRNRGISPTDTSATASTMDFTINNKGVIISKLMYERMNTTSDITNPGTMLWNEKVEIWGHNETRKDRIFMGKIKDVDNDPLETHYIIETSDIFDIIKTKLFNRELGEYKEGSTGTIEDLTEINNTRLPNGFVASEDIVDNKTLKKIEFTGHPFDFIYGIFQCIFSTPTNIIGYSWLNVDYMDFLDLESFDTVKLGLSESYRNNPFKFTFYKPLSDPFDFIKEQIFKPCVIFPFITLDGKLGIKFHQQPLSTAGVVTLDESKIMEIIKKKNSMKDFINHIEINYDLVKNRKDEYYAKSEYNINVPGLNKTKFLSPKDEPLTFNLEGINFGGTKPLDQKIIVQNIFDSYFNRYGDSITIIKLQTTMSKIPNVTVGDYVGLHHNSLIEWVRGNKEGERGLGGKIDPGDPNAKLDNGDTWSGFVNNNNLGRSSNNTVFLNTQTEEIKSEFFNGDDLSCKTNHKVVNDWLVNQGF